MSREPTGIVVLSIRLISLPRRSANGTPRRRIPTNPKSLTPLLFSTISWASRRSVRSISDADISCAFSRRPKLCNVLSVAMRLHDTQAGGGLQGLRLCYFRLNWSKSITRKTPFVPGDQQRRPDDHQPGAQPDPNAERAPSQPKTQEVAEWNSDEP